MVQETKKPLAGARGLRAGLGRRCPRRTRFVRGGHCGPARLLPIIMANESTAGVCHTPRRDTRPSHDAGAPGRPPRAAPADVVRSDRATAYGATGPRSTTTRTGDGARAPTGRRAPARNGARSAGRRPPRSTGHGARSTGHGARSTGHGPATEDGRWPHGARGAVRRLATEHGARSAGAQRSAKHGGLTPPRGARGRGERDARGPAHARGGGDVGRARRRSVATGVDWR